MRYLVTAKRLPTFILRAYFFKNFFFFSWLEVLLKGKIEKNVCLSALGLNQN